MYIVQLGAALHLSRNPGRHILRDKDDYLACSVRRVRILAEHRPKRGGELKRYQVPLAATYSRCMLESGSWIDGGKEAGGGWGSFEAKNGRFSKT